MIIMTKDNQEKNTKFISIYINKHLQYIFI